MSVPLESALARAGLRTDPDTFLTMVEDAARRLSPVDPNPADYFTAEQRTALTELGFDLAPLRADEDDARARTVASHAVLRESALTVTEVSDRLGVDPSRVRHRLAAGQLAGWKDHGGWRLPAWQFTGSAVLPGLDVVLDAVPSDQPALVVAAFMTTPQEELVLTDERVTPRQWLVATGDPAPVAALLSTLGTPI